MDYIILAFATWRLSSFVVNEYGPFEILAIIRAKQWSGAFECIWCLSVWIGIFLTIFYWYTPSLIVLLCLPFALSTVAILVDKFTD